MRLSLTSLALLLTWAPACTSASLDRTPAGGPGKAKANDSELTKDPDEDEDEEDSNEGGGEFVEADDDKEPVTFPKLEFKGTGYTTYNLDDKLNMEQTVATAMTKESLSLDTTQAHVDCSGIDGCDQDEVDDDVRRGMIGPNTYERIESGDLKGRVKDAAAFAIFAKSVRTKTGRTFSFDKPLPVYFWPVGKQRYAPLKGGSMTFSAKVTADKPFAGDPTVNDTILEMNNPIFEAQGKVRRSFTANVTVTQVSASEDQVTVKMDVDIPEDAQVPVKDWRGCIYKVFPLAKSATYVIDPKDQVILSAKIMGWSCGDKSKQREETHVDFKLCKKTSATGKKKSYACN